jgi:hypothetical protein
LAISTGGEQQAAQAVFLCIASAGRECALLPLVARLPLTEPVSVIGVEVDTGHGAVAYRERVRRCTEERTNAGEEVG